MVFCHVWRRRRERAARRREGASMNRCSFVVGLCAPWALALAGCGSSSSGAPYQGNLNPGVTPTDGAAADATEEPAMGTDGASGATEAGVGSDSDGAVVCNTLADVAPTITTQQVAASPPTLTGGTPADGTYILTALTQYVGDAGVSASGGSDSTTIEVSGTTIQVSQTGMTSTETVAFSGTTFTDTRTCPTAASRQGSFSATATTLIVQFDNGTADGGVNVVQETFTLQQ
jgi:hypothetical protein